MRRSAGGCGGVRGGAEGCGGVRGGCRGVREVRWGLGLGLPLRSLGEGGGSRLQKTCLLDYF